MAAQNEQMGTLSLKMAACNEDRGQKGVTVASPLPDVGWERDPGLPLLPQQDMWCSTGGRKRC